MDLEKASRDHISELDHARDEGETKGKLEGKLEGKIEVSSRMIVVGIPDEKILEMIGISEKELKNLHEEGISAEPE